MSAQDLNSFQNTQLAELDKQMAVWNQRLSTLDQQISTVSQALQDSVQSLKLNLTNLVTAADAWLGQQSTPTPLSEKVSLLREEVKVLYALDLNDPSVLTKISGLSDQFQALSVDLVADLTLQAKAFAESLDKAAADLVTHYGIQI